MSGFNPIGVQWNRDMRNEENRMYEELYKMYENKGNGYFENNRGVLFPLDNKFRDGEMHPVDDRVKNAILGAKVINPNRNKLYTIAYLANGLRDSYGFTIKEYDKDSFATNSAATERTIVSYLDYPFSESEGITTRTIDLGDMIFLITIDYDAVWGDGYNISNTASGGYARGCVIDESNYEYTINKGSIESNRGANFPQKNMKLEGNEGTISQLARDALLDVKIFGAKIDCFYRLEFIANGHVSYGEERWGITLSEYPKETFETTGESTLVFEYNHRTLPGNEGNFNWKKQSDGIETITVDNGEIACSVTVDRSVIPGLFMNFNSNHAPTAVIDPSNYFF